MRRYGLLETLDRDRFYPTLDAALAADRGALMHRGALVAPGSFWLTRCDFQLPTSVLVCCSNGGKPCIMWRGWQKER